MLTVYSTLVVFVFEFVDKVFEFVSKSKDDQKYLFLNTLREIIIHDSRCL